MWDQYYICTLVDIAQKCNPSPSLYPFKPVDMLSVGYRHHKWYVDFVLISYLQEQRSRSLFCRRQLSFLVETILRVQLCLWKSRSWFEKVELFPYIPLCAFHYIDIYFLFTGLICLGEGDGALNMAAPHTDRPPDQDKFPNLRIILMGWERAAQFCHLRQHPPACTTALIVEESCAHQHGHYCRQSSCRSLVTPSHAYTAGPF